MMKLLHLVASSRGGAASHVRDLALGLSQHRYQVSVAMPLDDGNVTPQDFAQAGIPLHAVNIDQGLSLHEVKHLRALLQQHQYDILHAHGARAAFWGRLAMIGFPSKKRPKFVYSIHGFMIPHYARHRRLFFTIQEKLQATQVDRFIAVSHAERDNMRQIRLGNDQNINVIWYGIDTEDFAQPHQTAASVRQALNIPPDDILLTMICRFFWPRDFPTLLRAFHQAAAQIPNLRLLLVGDGPWRPQIEALLDELDLHDRVTLPGMRKDVTDLLHTSDIFVLTSGGGDGLPISILEAMAAGRPVIATASDGIPEEIIHNETGLLVPLRDVEALAQAMITLAQSPNKRHMMGQANQQRAQQHFTTQQMVQNISHLYQSLNHNDYQK